jgi:hypothetical protein
MAEKAKVQWTFARQSARPVAAQWTKNEGKRGFAGPSRPRFEPKAA